jgi:DUF971 family protein
MYPAGVRATLRQPGMNDLPQTAPLEIEKLGDTAMKIVWDDGHVSTYPNPELRFRCSCASCVDEWTGERRVTAAQIAPDVKPVGLELVGNYAVQFSWSDGHSTGIYTWEYLRQICPCARCAARRGGAA